VNSIVRGDGFLTYEDVLLTMRRALDPSLSNVVRIWRANPAFPGLPDVALTTNGFRGGTALATASALAPAANAKKLPLNEAMAELPAGVRFYADPVRVSPGQTLRVPLKVDITGSTPVRTLVLRLGVRTLDGAALAAPITISPNAELGQVFANYTKGPLDCGIAWLNTLPDLPAGTVTIGTLNLTIPANANADALFDIQFLKTEAGMDLTPIPATSQNALLIMENRAAAPWNDEIPDSWRIAQFGSLMNILSAPDADADGDGMTTLEEYRAGTIPTDNSSRLAIQGRTVLSYFVLRWPTAAGKLYRLQSSIALTGDWTTIEDRIPGTGGAIERIPGGRDPEKQFYRVQIVP
jgi:hypothetical protein